MVRESIGRFAFRYLTIGSLAILFTALVDSGLITNAVATSEGEKAALTIVAIDMEGDDVVGKYVELRLNGTIVGSGFMPHTFLIEDLVEYQVGVADYRQYVFDHWFDTGSSDRWRSITIIEDTRLVAVYRIIEDTSSGSGSSTSSGSGSSTSSGSGSSTSSGSGSSTSSGSGSSTSSGSGSSTSSGSGSSTSSGSGSSTSVKIVEIVGATDARGLLVDNATISTSNAEATDLVDNTAEGGAELIPNSNESQTESMTLVFPLMIGLIITALLIYLAFRRRRILTH